MPLVSVLLATHDDARFLREAVDSMLGQTCRDLEVMVVDDASTDQTAELLRDIPDDRLVVLRNAQQSGLAASLNRALESASGRFVARLDADDIAAPNRLELQLARIRVAPRVAAVGTAVVDVDEQGVLGSTHVLPLGGRALRWHALFSSPFFHPTVLVDREVLDQYDLRYDPAFLESEDYDLWTRLFEVAEGGNLSAALVLKRVHGAQASLRRTDIQQSFQRQVALREIGRIAPALADADLAWGLGSGVGVPEGSREPAGAALLALLRAFEERHGIDRDVREAAARALGRAGLFAAVAKLAPLLPAKVAVERVRRPIQERRTGRLAAAALPHSRTRVTVVSPEPTPYRSPLFDRIAESTDVELTVIYAAESVAARTWSVEPHHRNVSLRGAGLPGARLILRHDYPITPGSVRALARSRPDVVVVSGWSTFAAQAAVAWCRARRIPYVLFVESHDLEPRSRWRRTVKGAIVPRLVRGAANLLVVGSAARDSLVAYGAEPNRIRTFANTVDVAAWEERADGLAAASPGNGVVVLAVGRLVQDKGFDILVRAVAATGEERLRLVLAGEGPEGDSLRALAAQLGVDLTLLGHLSEDELASQYVAADVFALLSRHEPWGVVVNEAAASGLPLVLSTSVGAAHDLLRDGENGYLVPPRDVGAAAAALKRLADDSALRQTMGARSRELVRGWGYEPSVENFVAAVREATSR